MIDAQAYLDRIGYAGPAQPSLENLRALHRAHLLSVPFENLDIPLLRRPLVLEPAALFEKIVERRRGGLCYELNGLFAELLRALGYRVELLSAAVFRPGGVWGAPFDHLALRVELDAPWLADVGFGRDSFREPLRLDLDAPQERAPAAYRVTADGPLRVLQMRTEGIWSDLYRFELEPHAFEEFGPMCLHHQTEPGAPFYGVPVAGLATPRGRITLVDRKLKIVADGAAQEFELSGESERADALREYFGIVT